MAISPFSPSYKEQQTTSQFLKLETGKTTKIRILDEGIAGFEAWTLKNKPLRLPMNDQGNMDGDFSEPIKTKTDSDKPDIKVFWAFTIWNYETESIQVWSFTQASIRKAMIALREDEDYRNILGYDLKVSKTKTGDQPTDIEYNVLPGKETDLPEKAIEALTDLDIDLDRLFTGEYPINNQ